MKQLWKLDAEAELAGGKSQMSVDDRKVIEILNQYVRNVDGYYEMDIPFKSETPELPDNKSIAEKQMQSLGRRLLRDPELHKNL